MPIEKTYFETKITVGELRQKLSRSELAALSVSSYCASDVNNFSKLTWLSNFEPSGSTAIDWMKYGQEVGLLRALTIRLFEFWRFIQRCKNQNGDVGEIACEVTTEFFWIEDSVGYDVASKIRDTATAHTSLKDAKQAADTLADELEITFLDTANRHNSFYSLGEEAFIFGQLSALIDDQHSVGDLIECWFGWAESVANVLTVFHVRLVERLVLNRFPECRPVELQIPFPENLVIDGSGPVQLPVYVENMKP
ncbi:hypothetical protein [Thalassovita mangrovi]|uniref:Uncharacterized protein n=1 Tax=Thalassovita mangrovi TaxID=2692236 RepID=A0A6L8LN45_9RHOB|nr:hypothetical protein [Thalassovita mangrovi]MYM55072.1 hypothetical protein [Thalassovita mangrovi]